MTSLAVRITPQTDTVLGALSALALDNDDKYDLLDAIGLTVAENTRLRFLDGVDPDGNPWEPSVRAKVQGGETLRDTGVLMNSITHQVGNDFVEVGTNVPYAIPLHFGATIRAVGGGYLKFNIPGVGWVQKREVVLPARPILGINEEDQIEVATLINNFLKVQR